MIPYPAFSTCWEGRMPRRSPYQIVLSPAEERELERISLRYTAPYYEVIRAKVVLLAA